MRGKSWDTLTDAQRLWVLLRKAGSAGVHSHDIRSQGVSGNPSQRAKDIVSKGQPVFTAREARNGRPGARYWLQPYAPDWSVPVQPNFGSETRERVSTRETSAATPLAPNFGSAAASDEVSKGVQRSDIGNGEEGAGRPARLRWHRDYTTPGDEWKLQEAA